MGRLVIGPRNERDSWNLRELTDELRDPRERRVIAPVDGQKNGIHALAPHLPDRVVE